MLILTSKDRPDDLEYLNNISVDRRVFYDVDKVMDTIMFEQALSRTDLRLSADALMTGLGVGNINLGDMEKFGGSQLSRDAIMAYLRSEVGEKGEYLLTVRDKRTGDYRFSLDQSNVLIPLLDRGIAQEFLDPFISYRKHKKASGDMIKRVRERFEDTDREDIKALSYQWCKALTGRFYTSNDNIQNVAKLYSNCMRSINDDYLLVWGDFDQIDLRVAYHTILSESPEDDQTFNMYDDKYEAIARIMDARLGREFNKENFVENRKKYKKGILARCYGQPLSRLTKDIGDKDFTKMLDSYYKSNKRYSDWYDRVCNAITNDSFDLYTYFGNTCHIDLTDCNNSEQKVDRVLNCPIQSTSNDIIMHMVNSTIKDFRSKGIGEDLFRVYMIRHDEPIFMIHKSVLDYLYLIKRNTVVKVDDWGDLTMSLDIGTYYTVSEMEKYKHYFEDDDDLNVHVQDFVAPKRDDVYDPFEPVNVFDVGVDVSYQNGVLWVDSDSYVLSTDKHRMYQIHEILYKCMVSMDKMTEVFNVSGDSEITFRNISVNGRNMYFNKIGA